jgi:hypothetical protein
LSTSLDTPRLGCRSKKASSATWRRPPTSRRRSPLQASIGPRIRKLVNPRSRSEATLPRATRPGNDATTPRARASDRDNGSPLGRR